MARRKPDVARSEPSPLRQPSVGNRKRSDEVADRIEKMIAAGEFGSGEQLPSEKDLSQMFGVGRPAVREALFILQQDGLVEIANGTRARVTRPDSRFLVHQLARLTRRVAAIPGGQEQVEQARWIFESGLAWLAAEVATDDDVARLKGALDRNAAAQGNVREFVRTDVAFHYELALIPRNSIVMAMHEIIVEWLIDQRTTTIHMPDADRLSVRDHTAIFEAIAAHDPARAFHEMSRHLRFVSQLYREAKRLSEEILRDVTHSVANRIDREQAALWATSFGGRGEPARKTPRRPSRKAGNGSGAA
jgi:GntR family transcriptional regulator, sialic acid-inducible nan operon repressor